MVSARFQGWALYAPSTTSPRGARLAVETGVCVFVAGPDTPGVSVNSEIPPTPDRWAGVGRLEAVPLRDVWHHEAHDFTRWLEDNVDVVGDLVGLTLTDVRRELAAGVFSVDLVATDDHERTVVIENQLEKSDHDHLGKLVTYLAMHAAGVAIWIVREPRPEHVAAVTWLNQARETDFFLLKLEAFRIGDSPAAPFLTVITGPSEALKEVGDQQRELGERHAVRQKFWRELLAAAPDGHTHSAISAGTDNWLDAGSGISGILFQYRVRKDGADVGVLFQSGDKERNEQLFDALHAQRSEIEALFGAPLEWDRKPQVKKCVILAAQWSFGLDDVARWPTLQGEMIAAMARLADAVRQQLGRL